MATGDLTLIDKYASTNFVWVWGDGNFVYVAAGTSGLISFEIDGSGNITYKDSDYQGGNYQSVWGDGNFLYVGCGSSGLRSYSVDGSGNLTYIDTHRYSTANYNSFGMDTDGTYLYVATSSAIVSYTVDGGGNLTYVNRFLLSVYDIWYDGTFIYAPDWASGLRVLSPNGDGTLTYIGKDDQGGTYESIWGDGTYLYVASGGVTGGKGLLVYTADGAGNLTLVDSDLQYLRSYQAVWGESGFVFSACGTNGILSYTVDGSGILTYRDEHFAGGIYNGVWSDGSYIYVTAPSTNGGLIVYEVEGFGSSSSSSSSSSSRSSSSSSSCHSTIPTWVDRSDNTYWHNVAGNWTGSYWVGHDSPIYLRPPINGWEIGFRPTKVRLSRLGPGTWNTYVYLRDTAGNNLIPSGNYMIGETPVEFSITWFGHDIYRLYTSGPSALGPGQTDLVSIEFLTETCFSVSSSSSSSSSMSSSSSSSRSSSSSSSSSGLERVWGEINFADYKNVTIDTFIDESTPNQNYGKDYSLHFERSMSQSTSNILIKFDFLKDLENLGVLSGSNITFATLYLKSKTESDSTLTLGVYGIKRSWGEGSGSGNITLKGESNWIYSKFVNNIAKIFTVSGCMEYKEGSDHSSDFQDRVSVKNKETWYNWDVTKTVRTMVNNSVNHGFIIRYPIQNGNRNFGSIDFYSSEDPNVTNRPYIIIGMNF